MHMTYTKMISATVGLLALGAAFGAAPASAADLTTVRFVYDWASADFELIPTLVAQQKGFYEAEGIKVDVIFPPDSQTTARLLAVGQAEIGFEATTDVVFGASQGIPITSIGLYTKSNNWGLFGRPGEPLSLDNLKGKSIAIYTDSWTKAMMPFVLKAAKLTEDDVKLIIAQDSDTNLLLAGKIDIATNTENYLVPQVQETLKKGPTSLIGAAAGAPDVPVWTYIASTAYLAEHGDVAKKWMRATIKATEWAADHPDEAAEMFTKAYPEGGSLAYNLSGWKLTAALMKGDTGYMMQEDKNWLPIAQALKDTDQIKEVLPASKYYTNELLK
ncbi:ABC transporter substrate-binding protein [Mesorhizobium norvegicum]|uniref:ABC transporter substrate-binding protein n=2 Tax=Mesorhizobium TaxID=68287 RepID=UPI001459FE04|nr:ABC transporter substrate-binding protein [Mesorhizobium norvegicum]